MPEVLEVWMESRQGGAIQRMRVGSVTADQRGAKMVLTEPLPAGAEVYIMPKIKNVEYRYEVG